MSEWNKDKLVALLENNSAAVEKAMVVIYQRQTVDERESKTTLHSNGIGFSGAHASLGTYYAKWVMSGRHLTGQHLDKARKIACRYTSQLLDEIKSKQRAA